MSTERVGIELDVLGYEEAKKRMDDIYSKLVKMGKDAEVKIRIDGDEVLDTVSNHVKRLTENLRALEAERERLSRKNTMDMGEKELEDYRKELSNVKKDITTTRNTINQLETASKNANKTITEGARQAAKAAREQAQAAKQQAQAVKQAAREQAEATKQAARQAQQAVVESHYPGSGTSVLSAYDAVSQKMAEISKLTSTHLGKNAVVEFAGEIDTVANHIDRLKTKLVQLDAQKTNLELMGGSAEDIARVNAEMRLTQNELSQISTASQHAGRSLRETFNSASSRMAHFGSALQSFGNALQRLSSPFRMLMQGTLFSAGYSALGKVTSGISAGFHRYDTMYKYPKMMSEYETATYSAQDSINDLDKSVRGLPTGLDEIVEIAQRYTLSLGDMEKGTQLAIATNNAFLASMATEAQQYQGMLQLQDLMNGKDLTSREWMSLGTSMGKAINEIGKELGYSSDQMGDFRQELYAGNIATEDFLNALIKVGTGSGSVANLAQLSKSTWEAVGRNIGNAFSRMAANVLKAFDEISESVTGKTLVRYMAEDLIPQIDVLSGEVIKWIKQNKVQILDFLKDMKSIDIKGLFKGFARGLIDVAKAAQMLAKVFGRFGLGWLGRVFAVAGPLGSFLNIVGGLSKGGRFVPGGLAVLVKLIKDAVPLFGKLKLAKGATDVVKTATTVETMGKAFTRMGSSLAKIGTVAGTVLIASGTGFVALKAFKSMIKDLGEIVDIASQVDWAKGAFALGGFAVFIMGFTKISNAIGLEAAGPMFKVTAIIGGITALVSGFAAFDTWMLKLAIQNIKAIVEGIGDTFDTLRTIKFTGSFDNIKKAVTQITELYEILRFGEDRNGLWSIPEGDAKSLKKRMEAVNDVLDQLKKSMETLTKFTEFPDMETIEAGIRDVVQGMHKIYDEVENGFGDVSKRSAKKNSTVLANVSSMIDSIDHIYDVLRVREWNKPMDVRIDKIKEMFVKIGELYDQLNVDFGTKFGKKTSGNIADSMSNLSMTFDAIDHIYDLLRVREWNKNMDSRILGIQGKGGIKKMFDAITTLYTDVLRPFYGSDYISGTESANIANSMMNLHNVFTSIDSIYALLRDREWNLDLTSRMSGIGDILDQLGTVMPKIASLGIWNVTDVSTKIDALSSAVQSIVNLNNESKALEGVSLTDFVAKMNEIIPQIKEVAKGFTDGFLEGLDFDAMKKAITDGLDKVLNATNGYADKFSKRAHTIAQAFTKALKNDLSNLTISTSITVQLTGAIIEGAGLVASTTKQAVEDALNGQRALAQMDRRLNPVSTGGMIYRAGGGSIFKPRGTDTVPAMLTPGEYVHNRRAVKMFGKQFMDRVNSLDINGAWNALQARVGNNISTSRTSTINNIVNNNNNARMTQNVYTNNPAFAKLRSNRVLGTGVI